MSTRSSVGMRIKCLGGKILPFEVTFPNPKKTRFFASHGISHNFMNIYYFLIPIVDPTSSFNADTKIHKRRCLQRFRHETIQVFIFCFENGGWNDPKKTKILISQ